MGYSSWNDCSSDVNEARIKNITRALIDSGLALKGYRRVDVDEGWLKGRDAAGEIVSDPVKFPSGMAALGDWVHNQTIPGTYGVRMQYGLYSSRGNVQCSTSTYHGPGSYGHYGRDAAYMAAAGADLVKLDSCGGTQNHSAAFAEYGQFRDALNATGRPIVFMLCGWNTWYAPVGATLGNSWRISGDGRNWAALSVAINKQTTLAQYAGPGAWNDPDLLQWTGEGSFGPGRTSWYQTERQSRSQFSMWAVLAAPLIMSADISALSAYQLETWGNNEVIYVNQDLMGRQGVRVAGEDLQATSGTNVWGRPLHDGSWAVVFVNNGPSAVDVVCDAVCMAHMPFPAPGSPARARWHQHQLRQLSMRPATRADAVPADAAASVPGLAAVVMAPCDGSGEGAQQWQVDTATGIITTAATSAAPKLCLDMWKCGYQGEAAIPVEAYACDGGAGICNGTNQMWRATNAGNASHPAAVTLVSAVKSATGATRCLDQYEFTEPEVDAWACNGGPNQQWTLPAGGAAGTIVNVGSGQCLTALPPSGNETLYVRDLWAHAAAGSTTARQGLTAKAVPGDGGSAMFKLSLHKP